MSKLAASFPCYGGAVLLRSCKGVSLYAYNLWQVFLQHIERPSITYKLRVWPLLLKPWRAVNQPPDIVMISDWTKLNCQFLSLQLFMCSFSRRLRCLTTWELLSRLAKHSSDTLSYRLHGPKSCLEGFCLQYRSEGLRCWFNALSVDAYLDKLLPGWFPDLISYLS